MHTINRDRTKFVLDAALLSLVALMVTTATAGSALAAPTQEPQSAKGTTKPANTGKTKSAHKGTSDKDTTTHKTAAKDATDKGSASKSPANKDTTTKSSASKDSVTKPATASVNLTGTWNIKVHEGNSPKTHIMAVKVTQKGSNLTASGVDEYGDVLLTGILTEHNGLTFKRTYKGAQVNPPAQYDGTFTPATVLTPVMAKGKWSAQPFADKNQKPKASANSGDWEANIFTGPAINK